MFYSPFYNSELLRDAEEILKIRVVTLRKLAASSVDIVAARVPDGGLDTNLREPTNKHLSLLLGRWLKLRSFEVIELNEIDVRQSSAAEITEGVELGLRIVNTADEGILVRRATTSGLYILAHDFVKVRERVLLHAGHENVARCLNGGVEGDGEGELLRLLGEAPDHRNDSAGRDGEVTGTDAKTIGGVKHAQGFEDFFVVIEGLALTHHDDAGSTRLEILADVDNLIIDFRCGERTGEATLSGGAENASHAAARLSGDANGELVAGGHADAFSARAILIGKEILAAAISGDLTNEFGGSAKRAVLGELGAKSGGDVGHLIEGGNVLFPNPVLHLLCAEGRLAKFGDECDQSIVRKSAKVKLASG